jgi:complement component 1 Q subcomponent-binding protein, mitochondrial
MHNSLIVHNYQSASLPHTKRVASVSLRPKKITMLSISIGRSTTNVLRRFQSSTTSLKSLINSELIAAKSEDEEMESLMKEEMSVPIGFAIDDESTSNTFVLRSQYEDESIEVKVNVEDIDASINSDVPEFLEGDDWTKEVPGMADQDENEDEDDGQSVYFTATISKDSSDVNAVFHCLSDHEGIGIESLRFEMKNGPEAEDTSYAGPTFEDLDEDLQKSLHNFLEVRGVNEEFGSYIGMYALKKENALYMNWLNDLNLYTD